MNEITSGIEYNCAVGIVFDLMRKGFLSTAEFDLVKARLMEKYGVTEKGAE